jgi:hypothetical protein
MDSKRKTNERERKRERERERERENRERTDNSRVRDLIWSVFRMLCHWQVHIVPPFNANLSSFSF